MRRFVALMSVFVLVIVLFGCSQVSPASTSASPSSPSSPSVIASTEPSASPETSPQSEGVSFTDFEGNVTEFDKVPERIISLSPAITEIVCALTGTKSLVGRTDYCNYPIDVTEIPSVGDMYGPNLEQIIEINPDVVIASAHTNPEVLDNLRNNGVKAIRVFENDNFEGAYALISQLGDLLGQADKAAEIIDAMKSEVAEIEALVAKTNERPTIYYMVSAGEFGDYAATGDTFIHQMIEMAGGENIASDGTNWVFSLEMLLERDPDIIIASVISNYGSELGDLPGYRDLSAVKNGRVYALDTDPIDRIGPRLAEGLRMIYETLHNEK